jgi:hypothetical protein
MMYHGLATLWRVEALNLERILAKLKNERRRIDKAISALEKALSAKSSGGRQRSAKSKKQRSTARNRPDGRHNKIATPSDKSGEETRVVAFAPVTRRVS